MSVLAKEVPSLEGQNSRFRTHNEKVHQTLCLLNC